MHVSRRLVQVLLLCLVMSARATAGAVIPEPLSPWADWVLRDVPDRNCTRRDDQSGRICAWPDPLELSWAGEVMLFRWHIDTLSGVWVTLPGDPGQWPFDVRANGREIPVLSRNDRPAVYLAEGGWTLTGRIRPDAGRAWMSLPTEAARIELKQHRSVVTLGQDHRLHWHQARDGGTATPRVRVYRLLTLDRPPVVETRVQIESSADGDVTTLGPLVPEGFALMSFDSPLPARLEADGQLTVQLARGKWELVATLRALNVIRKVAPVSPAEVWPEAEIWSLNPGALSGRVSVTGQAVDPVMAAVPGPWRQWGAWSVSGDAGLTLQYRDDPPIPPASALSASTDIWWVRDAVRPLWSTHVVGMAGHEGGLRVSHPWHVLRAERGGQPAGIQILDNDRFQVPFERSQVDVRLTGMLNTPAHSQHLELPLDRLIQPVNTHEISVHAPVGQTIVAIFGADEVHGSWLSRWTLWDLFFSALVVLAIGRTWGALMGGVALPVIMLAYHEPWTPLALWLFLAVAWVLPDTHSRLGLWVKRLRGIALVVLLMQCLAFAVVQGQRILYPQLADDAGTVPVTEPEVELSVMADAPPRRMMALKQADSDVSPSSEPLRAPDVLPVEVGPGLPAGRYITASARIALSGGAAPPIDVWRLGDTGLRGLRAAVLAGLGVLLVMLIRRFRNRLLVMILVMAGVGSPSGPAQAGDFPPEEMLKSLRETLLQPPACSPDCVRAGQAELVVDAYSLSLALTVSAQADAAWRIPVPDSSDLAARWFMDGVPLKQFLRDEAGQIWVKVPAGVHELVLNVPLRDVNALTLTFPEGPLDLASQIRDWSVEGISRRVLAADKLVLKRVALPGRASEPGEAFVPPEIEPYVSVHRHLELKRDWRLVTQVIRKAPAAGSLSVAIPLMAGESPLGGVEVRDRHARVTLREGQRTLSWTSTLPAVSRLAFQAPSWSERAEVWSVSADSRWRVAWSGLQPERWHGPNGEWRPQWLPMPGDQLILSVEPATLLTGQKLNVDQVWLEHGWQQSGRHRLQGIWQIRATAQESFSIGGLNQADDVQAWLDGRVLPVTLRNGVATWSIPVGTHELKLAWLQEIKGLRTQGVPLEFVGTWQNLSYHMSLPESRWLLWLSGPADGPAILLWGGLLVFLLVAVLLGRHQGNPLSVTAWFLLAVGGALGWVGALPAVVVWLYAIAFSRTALARLAGLPRRLALVGLVVLTLVVMGAVLASIPRGLTGLPPDYVVGADSSARSLTWRADWVESRVPEISVWTVPLWVYRALMWAWSLWLAFAIIGWLKWAWQCIVTSTATVSDNAADSAAPPSEPAQVAASSTQALRQEKNSSDDPES